jgi:hypothetical protein
MSVRLLKLLAAIITLHTGLSAQFKEDYIVTLRRDTIKTPITQMNSKKIVFTRNGTKYKLKPDTILSGCFAMMEFEAVRYKDDELKFIDRVGTGYINLYKKTVTNYTPNGSYQEYYFYIRRAYAGRSEKIIDLSQASFLQLATDCPEVADSLVKRINNWEIDQIDIVPNYNRICSRRQSK